jgi:hypothetical protein
MNCNVTLTADEFKKLHNGLCDLDGMFHRLSTSEGMQLAVIVKTLRDSLAGAYEQDNRAFECKHDYYDQIRKELGLRSIWSIFEVNDLDDRYPFEATKVHYKDHWGNPVTTDIVGATWKALYVAADKAILDSGDNHHVFIEQFTPSKEDSSILILSTGS